MASKPRRVAWGLVGSGAALLGITLTGCAAPQYTYVTNSGQNTYFKVPYGWHKIPDSSLATAMKAEVGTSGGGWMVAYEGGRASTAADFLSFDAPQPFVFAEVSALSSAGIAEMSYNALRDSFLPVSSTLRSSASKQGFPFTGFSQIRDQMLAPGQGVHGVRETFDYTDAGVTDTFDEIALTNPDQTKIYILVLHCTTSCYSSDKTAINDVMSSFTVRSP
ncbi:MAG: hypothetical protein M3Z75_03745 [Actinomycetota bacterium]|nr:hypothetical protein [Actinomycetota bacterium]